MVNNKSPIFNNVIRQNTYDNSILRGSFTKLKHIIDGCDSMLDAMPLCNTYVYDNPQLRNLITSYMSGHSYRDTIDIKEKQGLLNDIHKCPSKEEAQRTMAKTINKSNDDVYKKTIERMINRKHYLKYDTHNREVNTIAKKCPHCSYILMLPDTVDYVICGYHSNRGYDWAGCGRDWCFQCGKKLCKNWETDELNLTHNRFHDDICCQKHAKDNNAKYPDEYCHCTNMHNKKRWHVSNVSLI
jgi:hypothetical protein